MFSDLFANVLVPFYQADGNIYSVQLHAHLYHAFGRSASNVA